MNRGSPILTFAAMLIGIAALPWQANAAPKLVQYPQMTSAYVKPRNVEVFVPDACQASPCPVIYMQDGQNLFDATKTWNHQSWEVPSVLSKLITSGETPASIVVGIDNGGAMRGREYLPQKVYDALPLETQRRLGESWGGAPVSDAYLKFMVDELKPFIDAHYMTKRDAAHTFVAGSSMGGLISFYAQAEYPQVFGGSASLSMHWILSEPGHAIPDAQSFAPEVIKAFADYLEQSKLSPPNHRVYIDQGTETLDANYRPYSLGFEALMKARGWTEGQDFSSQIFPGENHSETAWAKRLDIPLKFLLSGRVIHNGSLVHYRDVSSSFVKPRDVVVWLPAGYDPGAPLRYRVIYMMDGQNLFEPSQYSGADWGVADTLPRLFRDQNVPPAIVVGVYNTDERTREYTPQKVYSKTPLDYQRRVEAFGGGVPKSDAYLKFLVCELKPFIDKTYATMKGPEATSIVGSSSGAYFALYAQGEYPDVFGASASLSMPWLMASPAKTSSEIAADTSLVAKAWQAWLETTHMTPGHNRIYTDQGTVGLDALFTPYEAASVASFQQAGWTDEANFAAPVYVGADHSEKDWRKRLDVPLVFILKTSH